jgi:hypothetical protein
MLPLFEKGFIVHLLGNAPMYASTVLECSCCRIHHYVAAPVQEVQGAVLGEFHIRKRRLVQQETRGEILSPFMHMY